MGALSTIYGSFSRNYDTNLPSFVYLCCLLVALLDALVVRPGTRLRVGLLVAAAVYF